jgi:hypothetical protein
VIVVMGTIDRFVAPRMPVDSLPSFLVRGVVVALPAAVVGLWCATSRVERALLWSRFARRG